MLMLLAIFACGMGEDSPPAAGDSSIEESPTCTPRASITFTGVENGDGVDPFAAGVTVAEFMVDTTELEDECGSVFVYSDEPVRIVADAETGTVSVDLTSVIGASTESAPIHLESCAYGTPAPGYSNPDQFSAAISCGASLCATLTENMDTNEILFNGSWVL